MTNIEYNRIITYLKGVIKNTRFDGHVYAVGGCCRDYLRNRPIKDIDLVVSLPNGGIEFANFLHFLGLTVWDPVVYEHFGTAMFTLKEFPDVELEAVQTRKEAYRDIETRNPETAYGTISDDCLRRDFTYNAIYHQIGGLGGFQDFNGHSFEDLDKNLLRTCGDPDVIFTEDPLRILRAVRFASRFGSKIEEKTFEGMKKYVDRLSIISRERIHDEFMKICSEDYYAMEYGFCLLWDIGAFKYIIPYLHDFSHYKIIQYLRKFHDACVNVIGINKECIFAAMLQDDENVEQELRDLKCSNDFINEVMFIINTGKEYYNAFDSEDYLENEKFLFRKFSNICGSSKRLTMVLSANDTLRDYFFDLDCDGYSTFYDLSCEKFQFYDYQLPIDGNDVMEVLGIGPSKAVGEVLERALNYVYKCPDKRDRKHLMEFLNEIKNEKGKD